MVAGCLAVAGCGGGGGAPAGTGGNGAGTATDLAAEATTALDAAEAAVGMVMDDSGDKTVADADTKLETAAAAVREASGADSHATLSQRLGELRGSLHERKASRDAAMKAARERTETQRIARGKSMFGALSGPLATNTALNNHEAAPSFGLSDLVVEPDYLGVNAAAGAGSLPAAPNPTPVVLRPAEDGPTGTISGWTFKEFSHTTPATGTVKAFTNTARVYSDRGPAEQKRPADQFVGTSKPTTYLHDYDGTKRQVHPTTAIHHGFESPSFPKVGSKIYKADDTGVVSFRGTLDDAPGKYVCTPTDSHPCHAGWYPRNGGNAAGIALSPGATASNWKFIHEEGAMVAVPDDSYYYFGWWVREDDEGMPVAASAFWNANGTSVRAANVLNGDATYSGLAAGLYGIKSSLIGGGDRGGGGHFTADVELEASFGTNGTLGGMIDNFRLDGGDEDPDWSVALNKGTSWTGSSIPITGTANDTVWTIGGKTAPKSGNWTATAYDALPDDGATAPTDIGGTFYTEFETTHRMVGAFGAKLVRE